MRQSGPGPPASSRPSRPDGGPSARPALPDARRESWRGIAARSASPPAASTALALLPITRLLTRHVGARLGGVPAGARESKTRRRTPAARASYCSSTARAAAGVEESATVGPEAMMSNGSPSTSEIISVISRPARQARASPPPLMRLSCLRTVLSCSMLAPAPLRCRVTASLSSRRCLRPGPAARPSRRRRSGTGRGRRARATRPAAGSLRPGDAGGGGLVDAGGPGGVQLDALSVRTQSAGTLTQPVTCFSARSRGPRTFPRRPPFRRRPCPPRRRRSARCAARGIYSSPTPISLHAQRPTRTGRGGLTSLLGSPDKCSEFPGQCKAGKGVRGPFLRKSPVMPRGSAGHGLSAGGNRPATRGRSRSPGSDRSPASAGRSLIQEPLGCWRRSNSASSSLASRA